MEFSLVYLHKLILFMRILWSLSDGHCMWIRPVDFPHKICPHMSFATLDTSRLKFEISTSACCFSDTGFNLFDVCAAAHPQWKASYLVQMLYGELWVVWQCPMNTNCKKLRSQTWSLRCAICALNLIFLYSFMMVCKTETFSCWLKTCVAFGLHLLVCGVLTQQAA